MKNLLKILSRKSNGKLGNCDAVRDEATINSTSGKAYGEYLHRICDRKNWHPHMSYGDYGQKFYTNFKPKTGLHIFQDFEIYYKNEGMCDDRDVIHKVMCTGKKVLYTIAEALICNGGLKYMPYPFNKIHEFIQCGKSRDYLYFEAYSIFSPFPEGILKIDKRTKKLSIVKIYYDAYDDEE